MDILRENPVLTSVFLALTLVFLWLWKLNRAMNQTPPAVLATSPHRWTDEEIRATYRRLQAKPIDWAAHLPPKLNRRYVVVGGSGGVGGHIILQLLARGESPESIRIVDFRAPNRADMVNGAAAAVDFAQADISSAGSTDAAFAKPWASSVAGLPLTVFHTAAVIVVNERSMETYDRCQRVNVDGAQHVMDAAKKAGANVFIYTSSASVALVPVGFWVPPWRQWPTNFWQALDESDFDKPLRPHSQYFGNYAHSKAVAERLICEANSPGFRTGSIRPANGVYGSSNGDQLVGMCLRAETVPTWMRSIVQNFVHAGHVSLGNLLFEAALLESDEMPGCAGRPFNIADPCAPPMFRDFYRVLELTAETPFKLVVLEPLLMLSIAYVVEFVDAVSRIAGLSWLKPKGSLALLQPAIFTSGTHTPATDAAARMPVSEGGLGYRGVCTSMEGMCQQVLEWNEEHIRKGENSRHGLLDAMVKDVQNVGTMPAAIKA